jgi:translation initiation factor 1
MSGRDRDRTVWSSARGDLRKDAATQSPRRVPRDAVRGDGVVRVGRATAGRKGKGVTTVSGVPLGPDALEELAAELRRRCGSGGGVRDGVIEIQGEHRDALVPLLEARGWRVKRAGG